MGRRSRGGSVRTRGLATLTARVVVALAFVFAPARAGAAEGGPSCDAAAALEDVPVEDREYLESLCRTSDQGRQVGEALAGAACGDEKAKPDYRLTRLLQRLTLRAWQASLLVDLASGLFHDACAPEVLEPTVRVPPPPIPKHGAAGVPVAPNQGVASPCSTDGLKRYLDDHAANPYVTFDPHSLEAGCAHASWVTSLASPREPRAILVIVGSGSDESVFVTLGGRRGGAFRLGRPFHSSDGRWSVFVTSVPLNTPVVVRGASGEHLATTRRVVTGDDVIWLPGSDLVCLDLQIAADSDATVLIDGRDVSQPTSEGFSRIEYLTEDDHQLTVLGGPADGSDARPVLLNRTIAAADLHGAASCVRQRFDLRQQVTAAAVGVVGVHAAPECVAAGVDSARLRRAAFELLGARFKVRDLDSLGATVKEVADFRAALGALDGRPVGAPRGRLDALEAVGTGAAELARLGYANLVWLELGCAERKDGDYDYSLLSRRLDLSKVMTQARDPVRGLSLDDFVSSEIDVVSEPRDLESSVRSVLARSFGSPYVRFSKAAGRQLLSQPVVVEAELYAPPPRGGRGQRKVTLSAMRLPDDAVRGICGNLQDVGELRADAQTIHIDARGLRVTNATTVVVDAAPVRTDLEFNPPGLGTYLLELSLAAQPGGGAPSTDRRCVTVYKAPIELRVEVGTWGELWSARAIEEARPEQYHAFAALASVVYNSTPWRATGVGLVAGVASAHRSGTSPPSWSDLSPAVPFRSNGEVGYSLDERQVYVGPSFEFQGVPCELFGLACSSLFRRVSLNVRVLAMANWTFFDAGGIPSSLSSFRTSTDHAVDMALFGQVGIRVQVSRVGAFHLTSITGIPRTLELFGARSSAVSAAYDGRVVTGATVGVGVDL